MHDGGKRAAGRQTVAATIEDDIGVPIAAAQLRTFVRYLGAIARAEFLPESRDFHCPGPVSPDGVHWTSYALERPVLAALAEIHASLAAVPDLRFAMYANAPFTLVLSAPALVRRVAARTDLGVPKRVTRECVAFELDGTSNAAVAAFTGAFERFLRVLAECNSSSPARSP